MHIFSIKSPFSSLPSYFLPFRFFCRLTVPRGLLVVSQILPCLMLIFLLIFFFHLFLLFIHKQQPVLSTFSIYLFVLIYVPSSNSKLFYTMWVVFITLAIKDMLLVEFSSTTKPPEIFSPRSRCKMDLIKSFKETSQFLFM